MSQGRIHGQRPAGPAPQTCTQPRLRPLGPGPAATSKNNHEIYQAFVISVPSRPFRSLFNSAKPRPKSAPQPLERSWQQVIWENCKSLEFAWGSAMATQTPLLHVLFQLFWGPRLLRRHRWQPGSLSNFSACCSRHHLEASEWLRQEKPWFPVQECRHAFQWVTLKTQSGQGARKGGRNEPKFADSDRINKWQNHTARHLSVEMLCCTPYLDNYQGVNPWWY